MFTLDPEDFFGLLIGLVGTVMIFSIPLSAIWTTHLRKSQKIKGEYMKEQLELEKLKYNNFLIETEKLRLELQVKQAELLETTNDPVLMELRKRTPIEEKHTSSM